MFEFIKSLFARSAETTGGGAVASQSGAMESAASAPAPADQTEMVILALDGGTEAAMRRAEQAVREAVERSGRHLGDDLTEEDLRALQIIYDDLISAEAPSPYLVFGLGVMFGHIVGRSAGLDWSIVRDQWGEEAALTPPGRSASMFPISIIQKRVDVREEIDLIALHEAAVESAESMRAADVQTR